MHFTGRADLWHPTGVADRGAQIWVLGALPPRGQQAEPTLGRADRRAASSNGRMVFNMAEEGAVLVEPDLPRVIFSNLCSG
jgi:hypothetical protein